jgi:hypothetical protein
MNCGLCCRYPELIEAILRLTWNLRPGRRNDIKEIEDKGCKKGILGIGR